MIGYSAFDGSIGEGVIVRRYFTEHPATVGESYLQHLAMAVGFAGRLCVAGLACLLHGFFPFLFERTGSRTICDLHERMVTNRHKHQVRTYQEPVRPQAREDMAS